LIYRSSPYKQSLIHYTVSGHGKQPVICFHGYGEQAESFGFLENYAGEQHSFIAIDLPFHGNTAWKEGLVFTRDDLLKIVEIILEREHIARDQPLMLMGFSLGGRMALALYESMRERTGKVILLAPDGLKVNFWYWLSTQVWLGNRLFRFTMRHPHWFFSFIRWLHRMGWVNESIFKFVHRYIDDYRIREELYNRWTCFRKIKPSLSRIKKHIRKHHTPFRLVYGRFDKIILSVNGEKFRKGIEHHCTLTIIRSGHQVLQEKNISGILPSLLH